MAGYGHTWKKELERAATSVPPLNRGAGHQVIRDFAKEFLAITPSTIGASTEPAVQVLLQLLCFEGEINVMPTFPLQGNLWHSPPIRHLDKETVLADVADIYRSCAYPTKEDGLTCIDPSNSEGFSRSMAQVMSALLDGSYARDPVCLLEVPATDSGLHSSQSPFRIPIPFLADAGRVGLINSKGLPDIHSTINPPLMGSHLHVDRAVLGHWLNFCRWASKLAILVPGTSRNREILQDFFPTIRPAADAARCISLFDKLEVHFQPHKAEPSFLIIPPGRFHIFLTGYASAHISQYYADVEQWPEAQDCLEWQRQVLDLTLRSEPASEAHLSHARDMMRDLDIWKTVFQADQRGSSTERAREFKGFHQSVRTWYKERLTASEQAVAGEGLS